MKTNHSSTWNVSDELRWADVALELRAVIADLSAQVPNMTVCEMQALAGYLRTEPQKVVAKRHGITVAAVNSRWKQTRAKIDFKALGERNKK